MYVTVGLDHYNDQNQYFAAYGTETATQGYNLLGAGVGGSFVNAAGKTVLKLYVEGTNLTNADYQAHLSRLKYFDNPNGAGPGVQPGIFGMGRNVSFKIVIPINIKG